MILKIKNISIVVRILINCNSNVNKTVKIGKNLSEAIQNQQNFLTKLLTAAPKKYKKSKASEGVNFDKFTRNPLFQKDVQEPCVKELYNQLFYKKAVLKLTYLLT